ncbi:MAG: hypothetical protein ABSH41_17795 [Syntrophobacteraceae bacterium]
MHDEVKAKYLERMPLLEDLATILEKETKDALADIPHIDRVAFRAKQAQSFTDKALDPRNNPSYLDPFVEIEDQVAGRVIVFFLSDLKIVHRRLEGTFSPVEWTIRRPSRDEEFGYESDHLILIIPPHLKTKDWAMRNDMPSTFELQIRTLFMHAWAEPQHDMGYKAAQELTREIRRELAWIAASAWGADQAYDRVFQRLFEKMLHEPER